MAVALDPQMKLFLDAANADGPMFLRAETPEQARAKMMALVAARPSDPPEIYSVEDRAVAGPHGAIPIRIYTPAEASAPMGILVFFHGGGWVLGNLETHDVVCRNLSVGAGCIVIAVDYRLAPEHKFPAAPEDCYVAAKWGAANAAALGGDESIIAVGGDSAGGNLATAVALMARERGGPRLCFQLLLYPAISAANDTPSQREFAADGFVLSRADMKWFWNHYLDSPADAKNPLACPIFAQSLANLPPALVLTASHDPLRDEGEAYAAAMRKAGVSVTLKRYDGVTHGFVSFADLLDKGRQGLNQACAVLRAAFAR
ncbi:MAG TPA: alpha/beta hydrolase [Candidatus Binataceae bacterium]|nr:alpha/beta hydrolase [Candidatus Binataceae bacterium]